MLVNEAVPKSTHNLDELPVGIWRILVLFSQVLFHHVGTVSAAAGTIPEMNGNVTAYTLLSICKIYQRPLGLDCSDTQEKWNHSISQMSFSHKIISPYEIWPHRQYVSSSGSTVSSWIAPATSCTAWDDCRPDCLPLVFRCVFFFLPATFPAAAFFTTEVDAWTCGAGCLFWK